MQGSIEPRVYFFEGFELDARRRLLSRSGGAPISLPPKALDVLLYLVERPGDLLDKDELMKAVWPHVIVEENNLNQAVSALRRVLGERPNEHRFISTEPGRGYRFVASVETRTRASAKRVRVTRRLAGKIIAVPALAVVVFAVHHFLIGMAGDPQLAAESTEQARTVSFRDEPSIAVLAFDDLSPDGHLEYFSDGISIELTELLTKIPNLRVIGRESAFWFKGKDAGYAEIGRKLDVDRVLEGAVQVADDQVRVTASLIDPGTGEQIWTYSPGPRSVTDVFAIQTELARKIVEELRISLSSDLPALDQTTPEIHSLFLQARHILDTGQFAKMGYARELLEQAVEEDPNFFPARSLLAEADLYLGIYSGDRAEGLRRAASIMDQAALRWPDRPEIMAFRALRASEDQDYATAALYLERALKQGPFDPDTWAFAQNLLYRLNRPKDAVEAGEHVLRRNPICGVCYQALTRNYVLLRRFEDAIATYAQAENLGIEMPFDPPYAMALLLSGDAEAALSEFRRDEVLPVIGLGGSAMALYALGRMAEYGQALAGLNELVRTQPEASVFLARVYAFVGDIERAFAILNSLPQLPASIFSDPEFDSLREHPRYEELLEKAGIWPDDWRESIRFEFSLPE